MNRTTTNYSERARCRSRAFFFYCLNRGFCGWTRIIGFWFTVGFYSESGVRETGGLGTQTGKFAVQRGRSRVKLAPTEERQPPMNHNQRYEARAGFPRYEGSPYGIPRMAFPSPLSGGKRTCDESHYYERVGNRSESESTVFRFPCGMNRGMNALMAFPASYKRGRSYKPHLPRKGDYFRFFVFFCKFYNDLHSN